MRRSPASTLRSATPTARTPGPTGIHPPTSTLSAGSSTSGSTADRSCMTELSYLIPSHRQWFNRNFSPAKYARLLELLERHCGEPTQFRHSETPCFLPAELIDRMARYGREMVEQLLANPQYRQDSRNAAPQEYRVPNEAPHPLFLQADFGLDPDLQPKLDRKST